MDYVLIADVCVFVYTCAMSELLFLLVYLLEALEVTVWELRNAWGPKTDAFLGNLVLLGSSKSFIFKSKYLSD